MPGQCPRSHRSADRALHLRARNHQPGTTRPVNQGTQHNEPHHLQLIEDHEYF